MVKAAVCCEPGLREAIGLHSHVGASGLQTPQLRARQCHFLNVDWGPGFGGGAGDMREPLPQPWRGPTECGECECLVRLTTENSRRKERVERPQGRGRISMDASADGRMCPAADGPVCGVFKGWFGGRGRCCGPGFADLGLSFARRLRSWPWQRHRRFLKVRRVLVPLSGPCR